MTKWVHKGDVIGESGRVYKSISDYRAHSSYESKYQSRGVSGRKTSSSASRVIKKWSELSASERKAYVNRYRNPSGWKKVRAGWDKSQQSQKQQQTISRRSSNLRATGETAQKASVSSGKTPNGMISAEKKPSFWKALFNPVERANYERYLRAKSVQYEDLAARGVDTDKVYNYEAKSFGLGVESGTFSVAKMVVGGITLEPLRKGVSKVFRSFHLNKAANFLYKEPKPIITTREAQLTSSRQAKMGYNPLYDVTKIGTEIAITFGMSKALGKLLTPKAKYKVTASESQIEARGSKSVGLTRYKSKVMIGKKEFDVYGGIKRGSVTSGKETTSIARHYAIVKESPEEFYPVEGYSGGRMIMNKKGEFIGAERGTFFSGTKVQKQGLIFKGKGTKEFGTYESMLFKSKTGEAPTIKDVLKVKTGKLKISGIGKGFYKKTSEISSGDSNFLTYRGSEVSIESSKAPSFFKRFTNSFKNIFSKTASKAEGLGSAGKSLNTISKTASKSEGLNLDVLYSKQATKATASIIRAKEVSKTASAIFKTASPVVTSSFVLSGVSKQYGIKTQSVSKSLTKSSSNASFKAKIKPSVALSSKSRVISLPAKKVSSRAKSGLKTAQSSVTKETPIIKAEAFQTTKSEFLVTPMTALPSPMVAPSWIPVIKPPMIKPLLSKSYSFRRTGLSRREYKPSLVGISMKISSPKMPKLVSGFGIRPVISRKKKVKKVSPRRSKKKKRR